MRINNLIARFLANKSTREEWERLESWKAESQDNLKELMDLKSIWHESLDLKNYKEYNKESAWDKINSELEKEITPAMVNTLKEDTEKSPPKVINLKWIASIAAAITLVLAAVLYFNDDGLEGYNHIASIDTIEEVNLPDGSTVVMNKQSGMDYAVDFTSNRSIILDGEAYFNVSRDEEHPFSIFTDCGTVTVLGTSFNVEENSNGVNVYVTSGSVKVSSGEEEVVLAKDDMINCSNDGIKRIKAGSNYLSWKTNKLVFNDTPLHEVISDISRHFNVNITFSGSSKAMNLKVLDEFENQDFESVMESIVLITGIQYIPEGNKFIIQ